MEAFLVAFDETEKKIREDDKICNKNVFLRRLKELRKDVLAAYKGFKVYYDHGQEW